MCHSTNGLSRIWTPPELSNKSNTGFYPSITLSVLQTSLVTVLPLPFHFLQPGSPEEQVLVRPTVAGLMTRMLMATKAASTLRETGTSLLAYRL